MFPSEKVGGREANSASKMSLGRFKFVGPTAFVALLVLMFLFNLSAYHHYPASTKGVRQFSHVLSTAGPMAEAAEGTDKDTANETLSSEKTESTITAGRHSLRTKNSRKRSGTLATVSASVKLASTTPTYDATQGANNGSAVVELRSGYSQRSREQRSCKLPKCMEYFSSEEKAQYKLCQRKHRVDGDHVMSLKGACRFMRGEGRAPVALASQPGSGNTWIRGLLEKATGICTGSLYCDVRLMDGGFNGESIRGGTVLVVKTHSLHLASTNTTGPPGSIQTQEPSYGAVVLLLRNPYHAFVAERNRVRTAEAGKKKKNGLDTANFNTSSNPHVLSVGHGEFGSNADWSSFIKSMMSKVRSMIVNVIFKSPPNLPKLVVRYEDFQRDRVGEVSRVLDFLDFPYSRETLSQRLEEDFSTFHRNRHTEFEAFTQSQEQFMEHSLRQIVDRLSRENNGDTLGIEEYLRHP